MYSTSGNTFMGCAHTSWISAFCFFLLFVLVDVYCENANGLFRPFVLVLSSLFIVPHCTVLLFFLEKEQERETRTWHICYVESYIDHVLHCSGTWLYWGIAICQVCLHSKVAVYYNRQTFVWIYSFQSYFSRCWCREVWQVIIFTLSCWLQCIEVCWYIFGHSLLHFSLVFYVGFRYSVYHDKTHWTMAASWSEVDLMAIGLIHKERDHHFRSNFLCLQYIP